MENEKLKKTNVEFIDENEYLLIIWPIHKLQQLLLTSQLYESLNTNLNINFK
jgi:hypothetical protein